MGAAGTRTDYDVAILGGGSGGYAAARVAAASGLKVVVIEGGEEVGGLCILRGCMPTKALLYAAEVMHVSAHAATWGIQTGKVTADFAQVMRRKDRLIQAFARDRVEQLQAGKFEFVRARARFQDPHTLELDHGGMVRAAHFIVATGSAVSEPSLPALREVGYLDSDAALKLTVLPRSILVLGGGAVALEFAQFFARMGVRVTVVQRGAHVLKEFDVDAAEALEAAFRREGVTVYTGTHLLDAGREGGDKSVEFTHEGQRVKVTAEEIFFALGRTPNTRHLRLDLAGVQTEGSRILTNGRMQTSAPHIYAAGDCTGPYEIVHLAIQQGELAGHNVACPDHPKAMDYRLLLTVVFTDPQVAAVGWTERHARERGRRVRVASYPFNDHGKSMIMNAQEGFVKLLADPDSGEIVGGSCVGPVGGELIHEIVAAMAKRMTAAELAAMPHYHPTLAEIWTYPAEALALT